MRHVHTSASDWKSVAELVGEMALAGSLEELDESLPQAMRRLFQADIVVWERYTNDLRHLAYRVMPEPRVSLAALHPAFTAHFSEHPGFEHLPRGFSEGMTFILSDFGATRRFVQSGLWREVYSHLHAKHQPGIAGRIDAHSVFGCGMNRLIGDYGPRDRELARYLQLRMAHGLGVVRRREIATQAAGLLAGFFQKRDAAFARVDARGRIVEISAAAANLLGLPREVNATLPASCAMLLPVLRGWAEPDGMRRPSFTMMEMDGLHVLALRLPGDGALVVFQPSVSPAESQPAPRLTAREAEILAGMGNGKSNVEIGRSLGISPRTVEAHSTNLFAKLGVESRLAAALISRERHRR